MPRAQAIAGRLNLHEEYVRELIQDFNRGGFDTLPTRKPSGRPSECGPEEINVMRHILQEIVARRL